MFIYCPVLVFFRENFGLVENNNLKGIARDFYNDDDLSSAKTLLMKCVSELGLPDMPHIPQRRAGPERLSVEIDDIILLLNLVDEKRRWDDLPRFVTDKTTLVPSRRLFEGDLHFLFSNMKKMEGRLDDMFDFMLKLHTQ